MQNKCINSSATPQHLIAALFQKNNNIEFIGIEESKEVLWHQDKVTHAFCDLDPHTFSILANAYNSDKPAKKILKNIVEHGKKISFERQVELYTYFMYGGLDDRPDVVDGVLQPCENYRHSKNCVSLQFDKKQIRLNGSPLKNREITMLDAMEVDHLDEVIAHDFLKISRSTYNQHSRSLRDKAGVHSKTALVLLAHKEQVLGNFNNAR